MVEEFQKKENITDQTRAVVVVDNAIDMAFPNQDCSGFACEEEVNQIIEEKLLDIAWILGISMEGQIGDLRSFIREMLTQEQGKCKKQGVNKSRKKSINLLLLLIMINRQVTKIQVCS